ncbi:MAG: AtpZ/AtpI family protein [Pirellulales bacterium]|nr:AtpZ/AtpI family protein [Pirellulales bacterium]
MKDPPDDRSALALGMEWTSRLTTVSLEMVLPGVLGHWVDRQLGTGMVFLVLGVVLGLTTGMWHLIRMTHPTTVDYRQQNGNADKEQRL